MNHYFDDITSKLGEPDWFEYTAGYFRYGEFSPDQTENIYAWVVVLTRIGCQGCDKRLLCAKSWSTWEFVSIPGVEAKFNKIKQDNGLDNYVYSDYLNQVLDTITPAEWISLLHHGDPPNHNDCVGNTMGTYVREIVQFWAKPDIMKGWQRYPQFEITLEKESDDESGI